MELQLPRRRRGDQHQMPAALRRRLQRLTNGRMHRRDDIAPFGQQRRQLLGRNIDLHRRLQRKLFACVNAPLAAQFGSSANTARPAIKSAASSGVAHWQQ